MPFGPTRNHDPEDATLSREDLAEAAREPLEDHSGAGWGAWGRDQLAQDEGDKSLVDLLNVGGEAQRTALQDTAEGAPPREIPSPLLNPTARDFRKDTHRSDEARMATEPPRKGP
jgi:hypothetical protein